MNILLWTAKVRIFFVFLKKKERKVSYCLMICKCNVHKYIRFFLSVVCIAFSEGFNPVFNPFLTTHILGTGRAVLVARTGEFDGINIQMCVVFLERFAYFVHEFVCEGTITRHRFVNDEWSI